MSSCLDWKQRRTRRQATTARRAVLLALGLGAAALVGVVAAVIAIAGGGGGSGSGESAGGVGTGSAAAAKRDKPRPKPLSSRALIAKADAICEESQQRYGLYRSRFPSGESEPDPVYSRLLVGISTHAVEQLNDLQPPPALEAAYRRYVKSQERVAMWDRDALRAAERGDATGYLAMREARDVSQPARKAYAEGVGLRVCSGSEL